MNKLKRQLAACALILGLTATTAEASTKVCNSLGGNVVFKDTLYGTGTGLIMGFLVMAATRCTDCTYSVLSGSALAGGTIGGVLGFVELATRDCEATTTISTNTPEPKVEKFRWSITPLMSQASPSGGGALMNATLRF